MRFIAILLVDWILGAWALMVIAGVIHAVALPVLIPFGFNTALAIMLVVALFAGIRGIVVLILAAIGD